MNHIETHAIASVPAEVTNLKLDLDKVVCALKESFRFCYGGEEIIYQSESNLDKEVLSGLESRKRTDEWLFGITPRFKVLVNGGELEVVKGVVVTADGDGVQRYLKKPFRDVAFSAFAD